MTLRKQMPELPRFPGQEVDGDPSTWKSVSSDSRQALKDAEAAARGEIPDGWLVPEIVADTRKKTNEVFVPDDKKEKRIAS